MNYRRVVMAMAIALTLPLCAAADEVLRSPDGNVVLTFSLRDGGTPVYAVTYKGLPVVNTSDMGFEFKTISAGSGFTLAGTERDDVRETWAPVWGENDSIANNYNALTVSLTKPAKAGAFEMNIDFRAYNDGVGFRYRFPAADGKELTVTDELTQFAMPSDMTAWWIPGDYDTQEYEYTRSRLSEIRAHNLKDEKTGNVSQTGFSPTGVQTSLMLKSDNGLYVNLHEAALVGFPAMHLNLNDTTMVFTSWLTPDRNGNKAEIKLPFSTPWRAIMVSDRATDILASDLIYNLNDPLALDDTSWIHPTKYMGVWWEMITGKSSWAYTDAENFDLATFDYSKAKPNGRHGANNENVRRYIDFAADNGMDGLLIEGWNIGWEDWFGKEKDFVFDFITPYPDFDIQYLNEYAHSKGVKLMMHHETSSSTINYERHLEDALNLMNRYGYDAVKTGYVGDIIPRGDFHFSQSMVNHYQYVVEQAAKHHVMVNGHEAVRPTGLCRTWPNLVGNESARGTEYEAFGGSAPSHTVILPFTRLQGGPMDYTPGILETQLSTWSDNPSWVRTTLCGQLALYLTMYSPLQMAADLPENYEKYDDAFQFIRDVATDWDDSRYLEAEPARYITVARKAKGTDRWFIGGKCNEDGHQSDLRLDFLDKGKKYVCTVYADAKDADYEKNPKAYTITRRTVKQGDRLRLKMAPGGGFAVSLFPVAK